MKTFKKVFLRQDGSLKSYHISYLKSYVGTRYSCLEGQQGSKVSKMSSWIYSQCGIRLKLEDTKIDKVNFTFIGYSLSPQECRESCKVYGLTGCEFVNQKISECLAVTGPIVFDYVNPNKFHKLCYPFKRNNECAYPKHGFIITNSDPVKSEKVGNNWECAQACLYEYECAHWSFAGCKNDTESENSCGTEEELGEKKFECKLYKNSVTELTINYTLNLHAGWGPDWTCNEKFICQPYEYQSIVKGEYLVDDREPNDNRSDCVNACKVESSSSSPSCVHFHFGVHERRCYYVKADKSLTSSIIPLDRDVLDFPYSAEDCHDMCRKKNEKKETCLQWDWRVQTIMTGKREDIETEVFVCLLFKEVHRVIKREDGKGESAVGTKHSCQKSQGSDQIYGDDICTNLDISNDCTDLLCCKELCIKQPNCNAINLKQSDENSKCILRGCNCTEVIPPTWDDPPYRGYSTVGTWEGGSDLIWDDADCENLDEFSDGECEDVECCKDKCRQNSKCTAINWKGKTTKKEFPKHKEKTDCILRSCKCTSIVKPNLSVPQYKGWEVLHPITGGVDPLN